MSIKLERSNGSEIELVTIKRDEYKAGNWLLTYKRDGYEFDKRFYSNQSKPSFSLMWAVVETVLERRLSMAEENLVGKFLDSLKLIDDT